MAHVPLQACQDEICEDVSCSCLLAFLFVRLFVGLLFGFFLRFLGRLGRAITGPAIQLPYLLCHLGVWPGNATRLVVCLAVFLQHVCLINMYVFAQYCICTWFILEDNSRSLVYTVRLYWNHHQHLNYDHISMILHAGLFCYRIYGTLCLAKRPFNGLAGPVAGFPFWWAEVCGNLMKSFFTDEHEKSMQLLWPKVWPGCLTNLSIIPYNLCSHLLFSRVVQG